MTEQYLITVETRTDILPGAGQSRPGVADNDSRYDQCGLPYMNAKTLKGHLREQMELLLHVAPDDYPGVSVASLLGETDLYSEKSAARIRISSLTVSPVIQHTVMQAIRNGEAASEEISYALSQVRSQTRIGDGGVAADGSLRQSRHIRKGLQFVARLEADDLNEVEAQFLADAVRAIQHIGTGKSKGMGTVQSLLTKAPANDAASVQATGSGNTLVYRIRINEPVKVGGNGSQDNEESLPYIPGSMVRGSLISRLLRSDASGEVDLDEILRTVRFSDVTPVVNGEPLFTCPNVYYADKHARREAARTGKALTAYVRAPHKASDLDLTADAEDGNPAIPQEGEQAIGRGRYASLQNGLSLYSVQMTANLHIAVNSEDMYRYEAIAPGQTYEGVIRCTGSKAADRIADSLSGAVLYLGGSRGSGYGRCEVSTIRRTDTIGESTRFGITRASKGNILSIYALSNLLLLDENGLETSIIDPALLEERLGISNVQYRRSYVSVHNANGYNHTWHAGQVQRSAVAAGSILYYTYDGELDNDKAAALEEEGIGLRREDGYGSILVAPDFSGGTKEITVHYLGADSEDQNMTAPNADEQRILSLIEQRVNDYRDDVALRESALSFAGDNKETMRGFSMRQITRLYSLLGRLPQNNSAKAQNELRAFENSLKNAAGRMYAETMLQVGGAEVSMQSMLSRLRNDHCSLEEFSGQAIHPEHLVLTGGTDTDKGEAYSTTFYQKAEFLRLALYDLMRQGGKA